MHPHELLLFEAAHSHGPEDARLADHLQRCAQCGERLLALQRAGIQGETAPPIQPIPSWRRSRRRAGRETPASCEELACRERRRRARRFAVLRERAEAPALVAALAGHPPARQRVILANRASFQTWGVLELLVERAGAAEPAEVEALARVAIDLADQLDPAAYGEEMIADLRARTWALTGHALQVTGDLDRAEAAFAAAHLQLRRGTGDALERAFVLGLKAGLRAARGCFAEADRLLARAARLFSSLGDPQRAGRSLVRLAEVRERSGQLEGAIEALYRALDLIDPAEEPDLLLEAWQRLLCHLVARGRIMEARGILARSRSLFGRSPQARHCGSWIQGSIARGLHQDDEAESAWLAARRGFLATGAELEAARVALELAGLYSEQGRGAELRGLAEAMLPVFAARRLECEARAAEAYLWQAADAGWPPLASAKTSAAESE